MRILLVLLVACGATQAGSTRKQMTTGAIGGLVRDSVSGESLADASLQLSNGMTAHSGPAGLYTIDNIPPGRYSLVATYAGVPVTIKNIDITRGEATYVDVDITLGSVEPVTIDFTDPRLTAITHYKPKNGATRIEGTITELVTHERVSGVVVTASRGREDETLQTVTDEQGRFHFDNVDPGTYAVSAYYSIGGRGQIEVRRSDVRVDRGEGVVVPLVVETRR